MSTVQLPDELQRVVERQVAEGRAASPVAYLEEAVRRLVNETNGEEEDLVQVIGASSADMDAGRYTTVATPDDEQRVYDRIMARLQARVSTGA